ncbi:predicted protein [Naegleria gruberi]|uniref:Predicted protein n=1 Tax=Naegleria gruberi TaxID=5762 RepID=D2VDP3_NAEGR|nr:uncharacterized protein NAEGRDRAFT_66990 [Naegleria gruberi]EFC45036.1 predicted protein [Naegleria gruberi]|eukprot:XP_002677780.1 predicted protein [Naegleria gruberi strain NEG-M]
MKRSQLTADIYDDDTTEQAFKYQKTSQFYEDLLFVNQSIASHCIKGENNIKIMEHFLHLLKLNNEQQVTDQFAEGCVNLVIGYFNKYLNGKPEKIGSNNDEIDDYEKVWHAERIGNGGFGTVLKVTKRNQKTKQVETIRAMKIIPNSTMGLSEAFNAINLKHPNVIKIFNIMLIRNICCIEMEYLPFGSLQYLLDNKTVKFNHQQMVLILYQCCEVLALMRQNGMVHSDIKPANILIKKLNDTYLAEVAICDFGLSIHNETLANQMGIVSLGGTTKYCAPELLIFEDGQNRFKNGPDFKPTFHSDIYSLGKTFQKLLDNNQNNDVSNSVFENFDLTQMLDRFTSSNPQEREDGFYYFIFNYILFRNRKYDIWKNDIIAAEFCELTFHLDKALTIPSSSRAFIIEHGLLAFADESLRKDRQVVIETVKRKGLKLEFADESLRKDKEIVMEAVKQNGWALQYVDESLRKDREIVFEAIKIHGQAFKFADESLRKDRDFILKVAQNDHAFEFADESLRKDRKLVMELIKIQWQILKHADISLRKDREVILEAVQQNGWALEFADTLLKKDRGIVMAAIKSHGLALEFADESLKQDKEFVLEAVVIQGRALEFADESFRNDREIVLRAVQHDVWAFEFAGEALRKDRELVMIAINMHGRALKYADNELKKDRQVVMEAVQQHGWALEFADESLRKDREVVMEAVKTYGLQALEYADESLRNDVEFMKEAEIISLNSRK